ncbi:MAG: transcriptional regulator, CdaR, partial [Firmicutes bacterium]|nr:transcriptional regulator, CdaR [Bacillota bacterium]
TKLNIGLTKKYDMKNTVVSLLNNNLNLTSTAKSLYIHRNTLLFRLKKLTEETGLDPCRFINHAFLCKILFED